MPREQPQSEERSHEVRDLNVRAWSRVETAPQEALAVAEQAHALATATGESLEQARSLRTIGMAHNLLFDYTSAEEYLLEALQLCETLQATQETLDALLGLCRVHYSLGQYENVLANGAVAVRLARDQERDAEQALARNVMAHTYRVLGLYTEALEHYQGALSLLERLDHPKRTHPLGGIAMVYELLGNPAQALNYYQTALEIETRLGLERDAAITRSCIGNWHAQFGDPHRAEEELRTSLAVLMRHGDRYNATAVLIKLADAYRQSGQFERALQDFEQALALQRPPNPWHQAVARLALSQTYRSLQDRSAALTHAHAALEAVAHLAARPVTYDIHRLLATLYEEEGAYAQALMHFKAFHEIRSEITVQNEHRIRQALMIQFDTERAQTDRALVRLKHLELTKAYDELRALHAQVERLSMEDALTGLYNRRFLDAKLHEEQRRAQRYGHRFSVVLGDIDGFKPINDKLSHAVGDKVLQTVASLLKENLRDTDVAARYGGEEFVVIFAHTEPKEAVRISDGLRHKIASYPWHELHLELNVTISMGVVTNEPSETHEAMLERADRWMYEAKRRGKNQVCSAETEAFLQKGAHPPE
jgi:diguanylate cyclase (GGDEF)-like protein